MGIVQFPIGRLAGGGERVALRQGVAHLGSRRPSLRVVGVGLGVKFCAACAAPVDFGAVWRGKDLYCSVECSLGGNRPA